MGKMSKRKEHVCCQRCGGMFKQGEQHRCRSGHKMRGRNHPRSSAPAHEEIAKRAYNLYVERGKAPGHDIDDWLQAERKLYADRQC